LEDPGVHRLPDVPEQGSDDGGMYSCGGSAWELGDGPQLPEVAKVWHHRPADRSPNHDGKGKVEVEVVLGLRLPAKSTAQGLNNVPVAEQGGRW
jgi:hypothetical protein